MRKDPELTEAYRKNPEEERFLENLNDILAPFEEVSYKEGEEQFPTLHVIGVPRSGTTLLMQLLCAHLKIGCINNLIAAFWKAPTFGIRLSKKLLPLGAPSGYQSDFARTKGLSEPHEFGYFWSRLLGYPELSYQGDEFEQTIDWDRVRLVLTNMIAVYGCPIAFKGFWMAWHLKKMQATLPKTCFAFIRRDPVENALSLLYLRRTYLGCVEKWASMRPAEYAILQDKPYWEQVAGQVFYIEQLISKGIREINGRNVIELTYNDLCHRPKVMLSKIRDLLNANGAHVDFLSEPPQFFETHAQTPASEEERDLVEDALKRLYGNDFRRNRHGGY